MRQFVLRYSSFVEASRGSRQPETTQEAALFCQPFIARLEPDLGNTKVRLKLFTH
ncbi:MAG: hypothetical protein QOF02_2918 [Blastocatellia bacterium]|jgi:hypothetical protein|nr:hypothetical protein [Blastocatellia bacterium]